MAISARNHLRGKITDLKLGDIMAQVTIRVGNNLIESVITRQSAEELGLKKGDTVAAVVKATEVMISKECLVLLVVTTVTYFAELRISKPVIPAKAGIQNLRSDRKFLGGWMPARAGMTHGTHHDLRIRYLYASNLPVCRVSYPPSSSSSR